MEKYRVVVKNKSGEEKVIYEHEDILHAHFNHVYWKSKYNRIDPSVEVLLMELSPVVTYE